MIGGGRVAEEKCERLLRAGARVTVVAPRATARLEALDAAGRLRLERRAYATGDLTGAFLAIAATDDPAVQAEVAREARAERVILNVVDEPAASSFIAPAVLDRGDLQIAVSTSGAAPALAVQIRDRLAGEFGAEYERALELLREARRTLRQRAVAPAERRRILKRLAAADLPARIARGEMAELDDLIAEAEY